MTEVIKRNGKKESLDIEKLHKVVSYACENVAGVSASQVELNSKIQFFDGIKINNLKISGKLSPKILIVKPNTRLSWQYHERRAEIWRVFKGKVGVIISQNDTENEMKVYKEGDQIILKQGERHRLVGLEDLGIVAEIWQHTDKNQPSDEEDIIRIQDDFGR